MKVKCDRCGQEVDGSAPFHFCLTFDGRPAEKAMSVGERSARRHSPVTRAELLAAIENVRRRFAGNGRELPDAIADAFAALAEELE